MISAPDAYMRAYHQRHPGGTARVIARGRTDDGRMSYDVLTEMLPQGEVGAAVVVDLGCGDGFLLERARRRGVATGRAVGVDMSPEELAMARRRLGDAPLIRAHARALPLAGGSVDYILSHLAFMLMSDIEMVVSELARVLVPGGVFSTIMGGGPRVGDGFEVMVNLAGELMRSWPRRAPRLGDGRMYRPAGMAELFTRERGFELYEDRHFSLHLDGPFELVWELMTMMYELELAAADELAALRARAGSALRDMADTRGIVPCTMSLRQLTCVRI